MQILGLDFLKASGRAVVGRGIVANGIATPGHGNKNSVVPGSALIWIWI
jgi:hypothetical protein